MSLVNLSACSSVVYLQNSLRNNFVLLDVMSSIENARALFPSFDDYKGAMTAIFRLQDTYHLRADSLADGIVPGIGKSTGLSTSDMFELGRHAYELKDWFHTKGWMEACLKKMGAADSQDGVQRFDVLDYLSYAEYKVWFYLVSYRI